MHRYNVKIILLFFLFGLILSEFQLSVQGFYEQTASASNAVISKESEGSTRNISLEQSTTDTTTQEPVTLPRIQEENTLIETSQKTDIPDIPDILRQYSLQKEHAQSGNPQIESLIQSLSLEEKIGQLFIIGHWKENNYYHTSDLLRAYNFSGVLIMKVSNENISSVPTWIQQWKKDSVFIQPIIAIDQEGGVVSRLRGNGYIQQSQRDIVSADQAYSIGVIRGQELAHLGITMNLAPVIDTNYNSDSFLYKRAFSYKQDTVEYADNMMRGMKKSNVIAVMKHFPGHYDSPDDSHMMLPLIPIKKGEFDDYASYFKRLVEEHKPPAIMTAHVLLPTIDPSYPATLSKEILTEKLRKTYGYTGVIITDDISMGAITTRWNTSQASVRAIQAGADIILFASEPNKAIDAYHAVLQAVQKGNISEERIDESLRRIFALKLTST